MNRFPFSRRIVAISVGFALAAGMLATSSFTPSVQAASSSASARIIKKLKKQIVKLKKQLAAATATPSPFIEMVTVGNVGNAADPIDGDSITGGVQNLGAVPYQFSMGKFEVTLDQYAAFLNAVAATDTYGLYHNAMETDLNIAGIARSGSFGSFTYSVIGDGARPVTYVSWFDAARFCNWLHNGRPTGLQDATTTERGVYTLDGLISGGLNITRNPGARFWLPSANEWYKAAFHQPSGQDGDGDNYWRYPTGGNATPGNVVGPGVNQANYFTTVFSVTQSGIYDSAQGYLTPVGSYSGSASFYGTFDQCGNVWEWNEAVPEGAYRGRRGGSWGSEEETLHSSASYGPSPDYQDRYLGFRVAGP